MDERLEQALEFSKFMETHNNQKRIFLQQYKENLVHYENGHKVTVTMELLSFCQSLLALDQSSTVLVDDNETPFEVNDLSQFTREILGVYTFASRKYMYDYKKIIKNRSVKGLTSLWRTA